MVLPDFLGTMSKMEVLTHVGLDDYADKLNFLFSVWFLMIFCGITTAKTYFLNPISCYVPNLIGSHEGQAAYINNYCYTEGTYNVNPVEFKLSNTDENWDAPYRDKHIYYYQWLPFLLGVQGIMFYAPRILWLLFANNRTGSDLSQLIKVANDAQRAEGDKRDKLTAHVCKQLELWILSTREFTSSRFTFVKRSLHSHLSICLPSKRLGTWLVFVYFLVKLLYVANLVGQLFIMTRVLQMHELQDHRNKSQFELAFTFGVLVMNHLLNGRDWRHTGLFPRSGCCAVPLRQAAGAQLTFAQCAIPVNMIHEKIFLFLWFWIVFVLAMTLMSVGIWCFRLLHVKRRSRLLKKYLYISGVLAKKDNDEKKLVTEFANRFLRHDGIFVLHMLALNCGDVVTTEICQHLYATFKKSYCEEDLRGNKDEGNTFVVSASAQGVAKSPENAARSCKKFNGNSEVGPRIFDEATVAKRRSNRHSHVEPSAPIDSDPPATQPLVQEGVGNRQETTDI